MSVPRVAADQWYAGPHVPRDQLHPGDLVFFAYNTNDPSTIHHVGIYVGGGAMIDSPHTGATIRFDEIESAATSARPGRSRWWSGRGGRRHAAGEAAVDAADHHALKTVLKRI